MKLHVKSNAPKIPRESTPYITLFTARSRIFLPAAIVRVALSWSPRKPTIFARLARCQLCMPFVGLAPVLLLRPNMAVLYHVNAKLQRAYCQEMRYR